MEPAGFYTGNDSFVSVLTISALNLTVNQRRVIFCLSLLCYCLTLLISGTVILTILLDKSLHEPMYILLCVFFINGLYGTTGFYPLFLSYVLSSVHVISYLGCLVQAVVIQSFLCGDFTILLALAYDRYVAICRPLQYHSIMTKRKTLFLILYSFITPVFVMSVNVFLTSRLPLCISIINRLFCANWLIVELACPTADTTVNTVVAYCSIIFFVIHGVFIFGSYIYVIKTCVNNVESRKKFMRTCVPHLLSLLTFLLTLLFDHMQMRFGSEDTPQALRNLISLEYIVIPPIINPLIYGFILTNIRKKLLLFLKCRNKSWAE